ncbi:D -box ATP-dependent RNA helicase D 3, partial [Olea europaea subsp. europaea]
MNTYRKGGREMQMGFLIFMIYLLSIVLISVKLLLKTLQSIHQNPRTISSQGKGVESYHFRPASCFEVILDQITFVSSIQTWINLNPIVWNYGLGSNGLCSVLSGIRVNKAQVFKFHLYPIFKISKFHTVAGNMNDLYLRAASKIKLIQINSPFYTKGLNLSGQRSVSEFMRETNFCSVYLRRGRAGRVQPGECYHLYPRCVYEAFAEYQLPELLRTPLNSLCLQIKSLQVGSIGKFLSAALQPPEPLAVQNAIEFLKMIGALDENENLTHLGKFLSVLPVDPKLGKMLILGAIFSCFDPILTIVAGLSIRDPFLLPQDKKDLAGTAKSRFSAKDYSDHMALVRAYEGWRDAEREGSAYEYCWRNFLSVQTLQAIHSLRKQFSYILKDAGLLDADGVAHNRLSHNQSLVRAIICSGLFPGIASVVHRETSMSFKTMDDGPVLLYANSVNARYQTIPYPWLVFGEKVKVNTVFIRDSTGVSDSILILFGGNLNHGAMDGHLTMLEGYVDFFMDPSLAECYVKLKEELDTLLQKKLQDPSMDIHKEGKYLMLSVQELVSGDQCEGRFVFGRESKKPREPNDSSRFTKDGTNPKSLLQTLLMRAGHSPPKYKTKHLKTNEFRALVEFKGMQFVGKPRRNKALAERDAAIEALAWLTHTSDNNREEEDNSPPDVTDNMLKLLGKRRRSKRRPG